MGVVALVVGVAGLGFGAGALWQTRDARTRLDGLSRQLQELDEKLEARSAPAAPRVVADPETPDLVEQLVAALEGGAEAGTAAEPSAASRPEPPAPRAGLRSFFEGINPLLSGDPEDRLALARRLRDGPGPARLLSTRALLELEPLEGLDAVRELVEEAGDDFRSQRRAAAAIRMLTEVDAPGVDDQLYLYAESERGMLSRTAARALEVRGDPAPMLRVVDSLSALLESPDGGVRGRTAQTLGRTGSPTAVPSLMTLLGDANSEVRLRAVEALGSTADASVIPALTPLLDDPIAAVRESASASIDQIRNPRPARGFFR